MFTFRNIVHWVTMLLLGALVGGLFAFVAATSADAAESDEPIDHPPSTAGYHRVEGTKARGFRAHDAPFVYDFPRLRHWQWGCNMVHGLGTDEAAECRLRWKAFYGELIAIRDSAPNPDYWPFPGPPPGA
jgi:hypothetical protein